MPSYLQIENLSKSYGPKVLFENISFNVNEGDKIALIAPNGTGKTSLMKILSGKDKADAGGKILFLRDISIAFLEQDYPFDPKNTILDQIHIGAAEHIAKMLPTQREEFEQRLRELATGFRLGKQQRSGIQDETAQTTYSADGLDRLMGELSGGEVKRVALTQMLALNAEFLIMDEPTNHLDIEAIEFLEGYLGRKRCTLLMVTHDRYFLDRVCNIVMELDHGAVYVYRGNYQNYLEKRDERISNYNAQTDKVRNLLRRELEWIHATPCARTGKAKYRIDAFHALSERASQAYTTKQVNMDALAAGSSRLGTKIIDCKNAGFEREGMTLLKDFDYKFQRYERVGIVGRNGIGKTTFLKLLTGELQPTSGIIERGESLKIGYYHQEGMSFDRDDTVLETVNDTRLLSQFLFPHDMLNTPVCRLSGGEKRRLYLLTILMQEPNLLILDEPTNDLDVVTLNILEEYLLSYKGTLIIVSHDRHFMDRVTDHLLVFCGDGAIKDFIGNFSEYRTYIKEVEAQQKAAQKAQDAKLKAAQQKDQPQTTAQSQAPARKRKLSYKEQRELEALEKELPALEAEKAELEAGMSSGTMPYDQLQKASERIQELIAQIEEKEMRWLELND